jgi:hypothetical protein
MFLLPIALSIINILLLLFVFPYDTPVVLKGRGDHDRLHTFMSKIYKPEVVQDKINELAGGAIEENDFETSSVSYGDVFCSPYYRKATFVGMCLAVF